MPAARARSIGSLNASRSTIATAIPSALAAIAASNALTISALSARSDPVHWNFVPSRADASSMPYWVGTKNGFVVTWLMKTKFHSGVSGKFPPTPPPPPPSSSAASSSSPPQLTRSPAAAVIPIALRTSRLECIGRAERSGRCSSIMSPFDPVPVDRNHVMIESSLNIT